jgi:predicted transcriptional regulator of viral defense system
MSYVLYTMQPLQTLKTILETLADEEHYLFRTSDFYQLFPGMNAEALRVLLGRAVKVRVLQHFCRGLYLYPRAGHEKGFELYHAASRLREESFCYLSLESVLSEEGLISQIPLGWITVMTGGRSGIISCGIRGSIEYIHTKKRFEAIESFLTYDHRCRLWRASARLALKDMRAAKRPMDLIDQEAAHELA